MSFARGAAGYLYRCAMIYGNQTLAQMQRDMDRIARGVLPVFWRFPIVGVRVTVKHRRVFVVARA